MKIYSPFNIEILLHYHVSPEPHPRIELESVRHFTDELVKLGVIVHKQSPNSYITTDLGRSWVEALCNVELPRQAYVDGNGKVLLITPNVCTVECP